ncbi:hypothetical protein K469DRAFT_729116 [Zopfia rhizophila CBS 207.26]|uniref:Dienelactone hydrolase domain-containing protein n=1 Tax=Zopfia rhizophila CBS 207.26 TaxID=1314779 RepID=A0A6A6DUZ6_9PEZI|nr:hypothetical protein K469DRAFT_729116 [Zopfia rhizophila CBS 207.26]
MPSQCCAAGEIRQGTPTGRVTEIHGLKWYVASPPEGVSPKGVIVIIPDNYAKKGEFLAYLPEFMDTTPHPLELIISSHAIDAGGLTALWPSITGPQIFNSFHALLQHQPAHLPVGVAGFYWDRKWTTILAWDENIPDDIQKVKIPTSIVAEELDKRYPKSQVDRTEAVLRAKTEKGEGSQIDLVKNERGMQAEAQAIGWFQKIFATVKY